MNWIFTIGISAFALLSVIPVVVMHGSLWRRLAWYLGFLVIGAGILYVGWRYFPALGLLLYAVLAAVPVAVTGCLLLRRPGRQRVIGAAVLATVAALFVYSISAARMSHARDIFDGVAYFPSYLSGQAAVRDSLNDPDSAQFRDLWFYKYRGKWQMCGEVNARNRMGGLVGFTRFYVDVNGILQSVTINQDTEGFNDFMRHCYGDDWEDPLRN